ncbi:unnamed protein product [Paramecium primaurelia]|uniref:Uncharacterized protein n=1 Tax=Paramecium primaurelia TaxID=5886 RepID=A0A8S1JX68_PARPR|nr:unnamed protein product [Paramecium primaurelia]
MSKQDKKLNPLVIQESTPITQPYNRSYKLYHYIPYILFRNINNHKELQFSKENSSIIKALI